MEHSNKILILSLIYENKDILFGRFSETLTHDIKIKKWKDIAEQLKSLSIYNKDWKYLRDTTWQNFRKRTIEKRDNRQQTGSGGGKKCRYDDVDELVLKIIGKDSPAIEGLSVPESSGSNQAEVYELESGEATINTPSDLPEETPTQIPCRQRKIPRRISINESNISQGYFDLKTQKMEIDLKLANEKLEIAKRERYKLDLEILKLERELNIQQPSNFTSQFYVINDIIDSSTPIVIQSSNHEQTEDREDILKLAIKSIQ